MPHKTVFTTARSPRHQKLALEAAPPELAIMMLRDPDDATLRTALADAAYLISERQGQVDASLIAAAPRLKLIQRIGSLVYDIDLAAAQQAGIAVCCQPLGTVIRVAEHVMLQLLAVSKRLRAVEAVALAAGDAWGERRRTDENTFAYNWSGQTGIDSLWERTVGILGAGESGVELARRLAGWGCTILYNKRQPYPDAVADALHMTNAPLDDILARSDYLVSLLPYSPQTDMLLNADRLAMLKPSAYLVSSGSGGVIDEAALAEAIRDGRIAGAALDTFEWEPIRADNPLLQLAKAGGNVILTPHTAAGDRAAALAEREQFYANIRRHLAGEPLRDRLV